MVRIIAVIPKMLGIDLIKEKVMQILDHQADLIVGIDFINHEDLSTSLFELIPDLI
jgi:hypothetical protein